MLLSATSMSGSRDTMRLKNSQMANLADARRAFQDEIGDVLGKKGARNVRGHVFDHLRVAAPRSRQCVYTNICGSNLSRAYGRDSMGR